MECHTKRIKKAEIGNTRLMLVFTLSFMQMTCIVAGDLAHTQVLDGFEELSHQLRLQEEGPLFIISSVNYDNYLAKLQQSRPKKRRKKKKDTEGGSAQATPQTKHVRKSSAGEEFPPESGDIGARVCEVEPYQGKQLLPPRPADRGGQRGEIDLLLLHERCGVILVEVKSTGYPDPSWTPSEEDLQSAIARSVQKAAEQLDSARDVLRYIMPDLSLTRVTLVVALPFLRKLQVEQVVSSLSLDPSLQFLCKEDLLPSTSNDPFPASQASPTAAANSGGCHDQQDVLNSDPVPKSQASPTANSGGRHDQQDVLNSDPVPTSQASPTANSGGRHDQQHVLNSDPVPTSQASPTANSGGRHDQQHVLNSDPVPTSQASPTANSGGRHDQQHVLNSDPVPTSQASPTANSGGRHDQQHVLNVSGLLAWWRSNVESADAEGLAVDSMRTIVGRICGLMSVVSVWTNSRPRVEVRTLSQALGEAGRRVSDIVLLPSQAELLAQQTLPRVWLTGPMGSGKTLMLQLKGRQWVREGRRVVVINVRTTARGRPNGHVLEKGIGQAGEGHPGAGSVDRCDVALDEYSIDVLHKQLADRGPMDNVCFVVDEVLSDMSVIAEELALHYLASPVWCVASYMTPIPDTFQIYRLGVVLRNPPSVQQMLKELDLNPRHKEVYTTRSAARGLPCDGPPVIFIEHSKHNTDVRHLDCLQCANELADIFETKLGLQLRPPTSSESAVSDSPVTPVREYHACTTGPKSDRSCKTIKAAPLSFRDIHILSAAPYSTFKHVANYHWEPSIPELLQYMIYMGKCRFLSGLRERGVPLKVAVDNTMKEICFPPGDEVIMSDIFGAHSLERKVVVYLRGGGPLTQAEVSENLSRYQTAQAASSAVQQPEPSKPDCTADNNSHREDLNTGQQAGILSKEMRLFTSLMYEIRDMLYPQLSASVFTTPDHAIQYTIHTLLGNMVVARTQSFVEGREHTNKYHRKDDTETLETLPTDLRVGSEIRENLPALRKVSQRVPQENSAGNQSESSRNLMEVDSVFLVPDLQEDALGRENEVRRLQRALGVLSEDDKDWELLAASRCLSQYISILP